MPALQQLFSAISQLREGAFYLLAIGLSRALSNVPATILLLQKMPPPARLAWAVNIGGVGLLPGSLANLIALRRAKEGKIGGQFHLFSLRLLARAMVSGWYLLHFFK